MLTKYQYQARCFGNKDIFDTFIRMKIAQQLPPLCLVFLLPFYSISQSFTLNGHTQGLGDSTWIYLTPSGAAPLDSVLVINGEFILKGKAGNEPTKMFLQTRQPANYLSFWLANQDFHLFMTNGRFKEAIIIGSELDREQNIYYAQLRYLTGLEDSLVVLSKKQNDTTLRNLLRAERTSIQKRRIRLEQDFVKQNPGSLLAANTLNIYKSTWDKELVQSLYQNLTPGLQESSPGKFIKTFLLINKEHGIGDRFSDIAQANTKGEIKKLSDIKGKYVLLEFWASWCQPCREENPRLVATYKQYKSKGFEVYGVSLDTDANAWKNAIKKDGLLWENVSELAGDENTAFLLYGGNAVPANFLIDPNGVIIARDLRGEQLNAKLKQLLNK